MGHSDDVSDPTVMKVRNPTWTREEIVLALDLYFRLEPNAITAKHPEIIRLSEILRGLAIHTQPPDARRFRNPNGVSMKLRNFLQYDPGYPGKGLSRGGKAEAEAWKEFERDRDRLRVIANSIREAVSLIGMMASEAGDESVEELFAATEGKIMWALHRIQERNKLLVRRKKEAALARDGRLACEVCGFDFYAAYGECGSGFIECHHRIPLSQLLGASATTLGDLALVCSNCHRMLHRNNKTIAELRQCLFVAR